jgi:hypothetical protein
VLACIEASLAAHPWTISSLPFPSHLPKVKLTLRKRIREEERFQEGEIRDPSPVRCISHQCMGKPHPQPLFHACRYLLSEQRRLYMLQQQGESPAVHFFFTSTVASDCPLFDLQSLLTWN